MTINFLMSALNANDTTIITLIFKLNGKRCWKGLLQFRIQWMYFKKFICWFVNKFQKRRGNYRSESQSLHCELGAFGIWIRRLCMRSVYYVQFTKCMFIRKDFFLIAIQNSNELYHRLKRKLKWLCTLCVASAVILHMNGWAGNHTHKISDDHTSTWGYETSK